MAMKLGAAALAIAVLVVLLQGSIFGGNDDPLAGGPLARRGSIPTATPPANLPEPLLLGEVRGTSPSTTAAGGGEGTYVVRSGDTLAGIAISLGISADQQAAWLAEVLRLNGIADARLLAVGQQLRLPRVAAPTTTARPGGTAAPSATATRTPGPQVQAPTAAPTAPTSTPVAAAPTPRPTVAATGGGGTYTVVADDFPLLIAEKLGVPAAQQDAWAAQLLALNGGICSACLQVGQVLQLPAITPSGGAAPASTATRTP
jgi:LysM repeat protein